MKSEAMPRLIEPMQSYSYRELEIIYRKFKDYPIIDSPFPNADLVKKGQTYAVIDRQLEKVAYFMKWQTRKVLNTEMAYQVIVWSNPEINYIRGYASKVFFEHLFADYDAICTDRHQTPNGQRFWRSVISEAIEKNLHVYTVDLNNSPRIYGVISNNEDLRRFTEMGFVWDNNQSGEGKLLIISKNKIQKFHK